MHATTGSSAHTSQSEDSSGESVDPEVKAYFWSAWALFKRDPFLLAWRLVADGLRWVLYPFGFLWAGMLITFRVRSLHETGMPGGEIAGRLLRDLGSPLFIGAFVGMMATLWLIGFTVDVLVTGGIWHTLASGVRDEPVEWLSTFFRGLIREFPAVVVLRLVSGAARWLIVGLGVTLGLALLFGFRQGLGTMHMALQVLCLAVPIFLYSVFALLVRLTFEVAAAPIVVDGRPVAESVWDAADFTVRHLGALYRLVVFALGLLLIPLFGYWAVLMLQNLAAGSGGAAVVLAPLRLAAELFLALSTGFLSILFYGALFTYYARTTDRIDSLPGNVSTSESPSGWSTFLPDSLTSMETETEPELAAKTSETAPPTGHNGATSEARSDYEGNETLYDLLPLMHDRIVPLRSIPGLELEDAEENAGSEPSTDESD